MIEFIRRQITRNFNNLTNKNVCLAVLHDGCWSKLQELYIGDSQDNSLIILHEYFALRKQCVQILWMRHLINCYGNITKSNMFSCSDTKRDRFMCQRRDDVRSRHIDVRHHFVLTLLEEKLAIFGHKTSKNQLSYVFKKLVDLNSFLYL